MSANGNTNNAANANANAAAKAAANGTKPKNGANSGSNALRFNATTVNNNVTENAELSKEEKRNLKFTANMIIL